MSKLEVDKGVSNNKIRHFDKQDLLVPWHYNNRHNKKFTKENKSPISNETICHRYYHVFKESELVSLCKTIDNVKIRESFYDHGNWCIILDKVCD